MRMKNSDSHDKKRLGEKMEKPKWRLFFSETTKSFYRTSGQFVQELLQDTWRASAYTPNDLKNLRVYDLGSF